MEWEIGFHKNVGEAIAEWPAGIRAKFVKIAEKLEKYGPDEVGMPYVYPFGKGLYEIRARGPEGIGRALFCLLSRRRIWVLSEFIKKTQKTPQREIELAIKRMKERKHYD